MLLLFLLFTCASAAVDCLRNADHITINQRFIDGGPGTKVFLCPDSRHRISGTIIFTAADQELATSGYPTGSRRATISIENDRVATAIRGDCRRCARISIKNIIVDGGRDRLGRIQDHNNAPGLIVIGGNEGQVVKQCWIKEPRGFTALHVREGDKMQCRQATIENNEVGPVGDEYDPIDDGPDPEASPLGRPLADGISIACQDSIVRGNNIYDCTDAGIVVYCSPGTLVTRNTVSTRRRSGMGGIFMVDAAPFDGDYSGVVVQDNTFDAAGRAMRVGIGLGLSILGDDIETILSGGKVIRNHLKGRYMGYGIAAAGLSNWEITDNWSDAKHSGTMSDRCFDDVENPDPVPFLYHRKTITDSKIQPGFLDSDFAYVVCIDGSEETSREEPKVKPAVNVVPADEEAETDGLTGNDVMDGIIKHSELNMLNAIARLGQHIDSISAVGAAQKRRPAHRKNGLSPLEARLEAIESSQSQLLSHTRALQESLTRLKDKTSQAISWETDVLLDIERELYTADKEISDAEAASQSAAEESGLPWLYILLGVGVLGAVVGYCQWRPNRRLEAHNKVV